MIYHLCQKIKNIFLKFLFFAQNYFKFHAHFLLNFKPQRWKIPFIFDRTYVDPIDVKRSVDLKFVNFL